MVRIVRSQSNHLPKKLNSLNVDGENGTKREDKLKQFEKKANFEIH